MKTLYMTYGLPASGKTTWAKEYQVGQPKNSIVRINKDDLRAMLNNSVHSKGAEKSIVEVRDFLASYYLTKGLNVIIDDTNLYPEHEKQLRQIAKDCKAKFVKKDFTDVSLAECLERNKKRGYKVPTEVIIGMYKKYLAKGQNGNPLNPLVFDEELPFCVIFDLDGTLAHITDRSPYDGASCLNDEVNVSVATLFDIIGSNVTKRFIFSGRNGESEPQTKEWLNKHNIYYDELHMRKPGDNRDDAIVKEEMFDEFIRDQYNVLFVVDDRQRVVDMWRRLGLTCLQCNYGSF